MTIINAETEEAPLIAPRQQVTVVASAQQATNGTNSDKPCSRFFRAIHINDCPAQKKFPELIVALGAVFLVARLFNYIYDYKLVFGDEDENKVPGGFICLNLVFLLVGIALFVTLCVYTKGDTPTTKPEDKGLPNYCDHALYAYGFWMIIGGFVFYIMCLYRAYTGEYC